MSEPQQPNLDDVMTPNEQSPRDRQEHAKSPARQNDDELTHRTEQERAQARTDASDPDAVPSTED